MDAFSATLSRTHVPPCLSPFPQRRSTIRLLPIRAVNSAEPAKEKKATNTKAADQDPSSSSNSSTPQLKPKKKPVYSMKKGQIVRVDKDKYLNSVNYLSVGHPPYYKGLDYIYEDRGEVLDLRIFETGEYALIAWVGVPTAPAWLPTDMLIMVLLIEI
ncbi:NAD(P)H-quinone oxidoreductase subunit O, chloroplastic [Linum perenne]